MAKMTGCTSHFDRVERLVEELRTVIDLNQVEASSSLAQLLEYTCHTDTWQREADADVRALPIPRVDEGQHSNAPAVCKCVRNAVYRPTLIYAIGCRHHSGTAARRGPTEAFLNSTRSHIALFQVAYRHWPGHLTAAGRRLVARRIGRLRHGVAQRGGAYNAYNKRNRRDCH